MVNQWVDAITAALKPMMQILVAILLLLITGLIIDIKQTTTSTEISDLRLFANFWKCLVLLAGTMLSICSNESRWKCFYWMQLVEVLPVGSASRDGGTDTENFDISSSVVSSLF